MRSYWDERARLNAAWYVDTSLQYDSPDMKKFFEAGRTIVSEALDDPHVSPPSGDLAVEIGSGLGRICLALSERFDRVIGIDISPEMVSRARSLIQSERVTFEIGDGQSLQPIASGTADLVLSFTVFQHIPKVSVIEGYIQDVGRVLKPGGLFVFQWNNTPGSIRWAIRRQALATAQRMGFGGERYGRNEPAFLGSRVSLRRIRRALRRGGMDLRRTRRLGELFAFAWAIRTR